VGAVSSAGEDSLVAPCEVDTGSGPLNTGGVASAAGVLLAVVGVPVEDLVGTAVGPDVGTIQAPVKGNNEGRVLSEFALE